MEVCLGSVDSLRLPKVQETRQEMQRGLLDRGVVCSIWTFFGDVILSNAGMNSVVACL